ncbi:hypothetical protein [Polluticoccus soli]|uniref:hypothetical protein n=1 Tax=Polluticoccus soli TaxID=3034150 RepID=UPI0023E181E5|nr:hypothetical protein [Flavipsychrobacter sp. JY13-12]
MESRNTQYPVYVPDQFLTNENLNETTGYVEIEERATRSYLLGNGVMKGLNITKTNLSGTNVLSYEVMPGYGVTPDGYLLETANALAANPAALVLGFATDEGSYKFIKSASRKIFVNNDENLSEFMNGAVPKPGVTVTEVKCVEIFTAAPDPQVDKRTISPNIQTAAAKIAGFNLNNCVLAFVADIDDVQYDNCSQGDCNDKGTDRIIKGRYVIIPVSSLQITTNNASLLTINYLLMSRLPKISAVTNPGEYLTNVTNTFNTNKSAIVAKLGVIATNANSLIPRLGMDLAIAKLNTFNPASQTNFVSYYLGFIYDMQQAINEYLAVYNDFATKYPIINGDRIDRLIILGGLGVSGAGTDPYRYYYRSVAQADAYKYQFEKLQRLYRRIMALINQFFNVASALVTKIGATSAAVKIIPSAEFSMPLGDKAIPYYYNVDGVNDLLKYWRAHAPESQIDHINNYFLAPQVPFATQNINDKNFFRIEGHLGLGFSDALSKVSSLISTHDLPVKVIAVNLKKPTSPPIKGLWDNFRDKYKKFTDDLLTAKINYKTHVPVVNYLWQDFNQWSYRDTASIQKVLNDVSAVMKPVESYKKAGTQQEKDKIATNWVFSKLAKDQQTTIGNSIAIADLLKARQDLEVAIKTTPPSDVVTIADFFGLEYLGGVYKGGTFILLHDGAKVVGDCSLPYFVNEK